MARRQAFTWPTPVPRKRAASVSRAHIGRFPGPLIRDTVIVGRRRGIRSVPVGAYGGDYTGASDGTLVTVYMSPAYQPDDSILQAWADLFDSFIHGSELADITVYVAPPDEVQAACNSADAVGCFSSDSDTLTVPGTDPSASQTKEEVALHEYGHAIAYARVNPYDPTGTAVTWGPEYWASYEGVCPRTAAGQAFPGDEGAHYAQDPGEAWADTYRMLNGGQPSLWQFDNEFYPNATDFRLARDDIDNPWSGNERLTAGGRFRPHRAQNARFNLSTFDDGPGASVTLTTHGPLRAGLFLSWQNGSLIGQFTGTRHVKTIRFAVCGGSNVRIRVKRLYGYGTFSLVAIRP